MNTYLTGTTVKRLREARGLTQGALAEQIGVSSKAVSKWETAKGLPDITLLEPLARALGVSVAELLSGDTVTNRNRAGNLRRLKFYVCPLCGNVLTATGEAAISCCGVTLPAQEAEECDEEHRVTVETVEDERFITVDHPMEKTHYLSFIAYVTADRVQLVKLYPEGNPETRIQPRGGGDLYLYCNRHGLMKQRITR